MSNDDPCVSTDRVFPPVAFIRYQTQRGLEIESVGGGLAVLAGLITGRPPELSFGFSAVNVEGSLAPAILRVLPIATAAAFGLLALVGWRRIRAEVAAVGRVRPVTVSTLTAASVLVLLVTSKVYSIQYVVWLVPLVALLPRPQFWLAAVAVALTMPIHPVLFAGTRRAGRAGDGPRQLRARGQGLDAERGLARARGRGNHDQQRAAWARWLRAGRF